MVRWKGTGLDGHGLFAVAVILAIWVVWIVTLPAEGITTKADLTVGWYYFFLSVAYGVVILISQTDARRHRRAIGGHLFVVMAWSAVLLKPAFKNGDDAADRLDNDFYLFAFVICLTLGLLAPFVAYRGGARLAWGNATKRIKEEIGAEAYAKWVEPMRLVDLGRTLHIAVPAHENTNPNDTLKQRADEEMVSTIRLITRELASEHVDVHFIIDNSCASPAAAPDPSVTASGRTTPDGATPQGA